MGGIGHSMAVQFGEVRYKNFGRCLKIENAFVEIYVTLDVGPRVIRYALKGGENFFFEDRTRKIKEEPKAMLDYYGRGACWYIYGGHRVWQSPEFMPQTYYPDNNRVSYELTGNTARFTAQPQAKNGIQVGLDITLPDYGNNALVANRITNVSEEPKMFGVWALTVLAAGGVEIIPQNTQRDGYLPNRGVSLWPYTNPGDKRAFWDREYIMLKQDKRATDAFKIGTDNRRGWAAYALRDAMFVKEFDHVQNARYPDGGVSFETYTSAYFLEMESLSPLASVEPGQTVTHTERWDIVDDIKQPKLGDLRAVDELVKKFIGK